MASLQNRPSVCHPNCINLVSCQENSKLTVHERESTQIYKPCSNFTSEVLVIPGVGEFSPLNLAVKF